MRIPGVRQYLGIAEVIRWKPEDLPMTTFSVSHLLQEWYFKRELLQQCIKRHVTTVQKRFVTSKKNVIRVKLDRVGPVDNRPSTDKLHHLVQKEEEQITPDIWHVTRGGGWTFCQNFSSLALTVCVKLCFEGLEEKDHSLKSVCKHPHRP